MMNMPLFPLNTLVCPGGKLPLRIFEPRYLDMLKACLKEESGFVIVMLKQGGEADGYASRFYQVGTIVTIVDFDQCDDGILEITVEGQSRVHIPSFQCQADGLWCGDVDITMEESFVALPSEYLELKSVLQALVQHPVVKELNMDIDYGDGRQVGWRLTELLPLENAQKQCLFEMNDPIHRLEKISDQLDLMGS